MDFYMVGNQPFLSCIDVYSKFATLVEVTGRDWLEAKRAILKVFNKMGKPQEIKAEKPNQDDIFIYAGTPDYDTQENKMNRIE